MMLCIALEAALTDQIAQGACLTRMHPLFVSACQQQGRARTARQALQCSAPQLPHGALSSAL